MDSPTAAPRLAWLRDATLAWAVLALGATLSVLAWRNAHRQQAREAAIQFNAEVDRLDALLGASVKSRLTVLKACQGLFDASDEVDPGEWSVFVARFDLRSNFVGLQHLGYTGLVRPEEVGAFEKRASALLSVPYRIYPPSDRPWATPLLYLQPPVMAQGGLLGWDLQADPSRGEAIRGAVRSGELALTGPLQLRGDTPEENKQHAGVVAYLPVYRKGPRAETVEGRQAAARGIVFGSFYADVLLRSLEPERDGIRLAVEDLGSAGAAPLLAPGAAPHPRFRFSRTQDHAFGGRVWRATYTPAATFRSGQAAWGPTLLLASGLALSGLAFAFIRSLVLGRRRALDLASQLHQSEDRFRAMAETAPCIIVVYSEVIEYVNPYACARLGLPAEQILNRPFWHHVHPEDQARVRAMGEARRRGEVVPNRWEFRLVTAAGQPLWVDFSSGVIRLEGRTLGLGTAFDISERVQAVEARVAMERKLLETQKLESLGVLAGGLAHDFNNLLASILGHASLAEQSVPPDSPVGRGLATIQKACQRAAELTRQMLAYSGRGKFVVGPLDLNETVEGLSSLLAVSIPKSVDLDIRLDPSLPVLLGDQAQVQQVVMNLITNAAEAIAGAEAGHIVLRTFVEDLGGAELAQLTVGQYLLAGPYVCLEVEDTGAGMEPETVARIFDPFFTTKFTGRGLGLAAMQGIVRGHEGGILVRSAPGSGSAFRVYFPILSRGNRPEARETVGGGTWTGQGAILVVDDEPDIRSLASETLGRAGFRILEAANGREALACYEAHREEIRAVVLDLTMPGMSGEEVYRRLRALSPDLKIILSSGYSEQEVLASLRRTDIAGFLQKPYRVAQLMSLVRSVLEGERPA